MHPGRKEGWHIQRQTIFSIIFLLTAGGLWSCNAPAMPVETAEHRPSPAQDRSEPGIPDILNATGMDATHYYLSTAVELTSRRIDAFFGEDRLYDDVTGSWVQLRGRIAWREAGEYDLAGKFRLKLDLPRLGERVNLIIAGENDDDATAEMTDLETERPLYELRDPDLSAALRFILKEKRHWTLNIRPGLKLSDPLESFVTLQFIRTRVHQGTWLSRGAIELGFHSSEGWENQWELQLERAVGANNFLRTTSSVLWREADPGNQTLGQMLRLTHTFSRSRLIAWEIGARAETRPDLRTTAYFSSLRLRRNLKRSWLFFELKPELRLTRDSDFAPEALFTLTLDALIGGKYLPQH